MNIITELYNLFQYIVLLLSVGLQKYGFNSIFAVGGTKQNITETYYLLAQYYGGEIRIVAGHGINSVLAKRTKDIIEQNNYFYASFDKWIMQEFELMLETNGEQAKNLQMKWIL